MPDWYGGGTHDGPPDNPPCALAKWLMGCAVGAGIGCCEKKGLLDHEGGMKGGFGGKPGGGRT